MMLTLFCQILEVVVLFQLFLPELVLRHLTEIRCHFLNLCELGYFNGSFVLKSLAVHISYSKTEIQQILLYS